MSETVERNNRFYEQPNGEMLTENEQLKEWLVIANKHNEELQKERDMYKTSFETMSENYFKLENIIKEVREYLKFLKEHYKELRKSPVKDSYFINDMLRQMFIQSIENYLVGIEDILDKESK